MEGWEEIAASERRSPVGSLTQLRSQAPAGGGSQSHHDPNPVKSSG